MGRQAWLAGGRASVPISRRPPEYVLGRELSPKLKLQ